VSFTRSRHIRLDRARDDFIEALAKKNKTPYSEALRLVVDFAMMQSSGEFA
jgi:hypothetical protein